MRSARLGRVLGHILPRLGLPVERVAVAVIHLTRRIHPDQSRPTTRSSRLRRRRSSRALLHRNRCGSRRRRRNGCNRGSRSRRRKGWRRLRDRSRRRQLRWSSRIPRLYSLMPATRATLRSRHRIRSIPANPRRSHRSSRRRLRHHARGPHPKHASHDQYLHRNCRNPRKSFSLKSTTPPS